MSETRLGSALARAIVAVREGAGDDWAPVAVVVPSDTNGVLARQQLALAGPFIQVHFVTPERLVSQLGLRGLILAGKTAEPRGWSRTTIAALLGSDAVTKLAGRALVGAGWPAAFERALDALERGGVTASNLRDPIHEGARPELRAVLAHLLVERAAARTAEGFFGSQELADSATRMLQAPDQNQPMLRIRGAVLLGDRELAPQTYSVLKGWLSTRSHVELALAPFSNLSAAPFGLRSAGSGPTVHVPECEGALGTLQAGLFSDVVGDAPRTLAPPSGVHVCSTPDEARGPMEAVRVAQRAVLAGTPLERIAIVLPSAEPVTRLEDALSKAGLPATWMVGKPLNQSTAARALVLALTVAADPKEARAESLYNLLRTPGLQLKRRLTTDATIGRGRWRRMLAKCGAPRGLAAIRAAVERHFVEPDDSAQDPKSVAAAKALLMSLDGLTEAIFGLDDGHRTLGEFGQAWAAWVEAWLPSSQTAARLTHLLREWGASPPMPIAKAIAELRQNLEDTPQLDGKLTEPKLRVVSPMGLLGGAFDVVIALDLRDRVLPGRAREEALLPDELLASLNELGRPLSSSGARLDVQRRRFAALIAACEGELWLLAPRQEHLKGRPVLPSRFFLDVVSVLEGRRMGYKGLREHMAVIGSRSKPVSCTPEDAVGSVELSVAAALQSPAGAVEFLARGQWSGRLLRWVRGVEQGLFGPESGHVERALVDWPEPEKPLTATQLETLTRSPAKAFFRDALKAYPAVSFRRRFDPLNKWTRTRLLRECLEAALAAKTALIPAAQTHWDLEVADRQFDDPGIDKEAISVARELLARRLEAIATQLSLEPVAVAGIEGDVSGLSEWAISDESLVGDGSVVQVVEKCPTRTPLKAGFAGIALALTAESESAVFVAIDGRTNRIAVSKYHDELAEELAIAGRRVAAGWWPFNGSDFCLSWDHVETDLAADDGLVMCEADEGGER